VVGPPAQTLLMERKPLRDLARQSRERQAIGAVRPEHVAARPAAPGSDVPPANRGTRARQFPIEHKQVVGTRLHAELGRPAIADSGELGTQPLADPRRTWREDPWSGALQVAL